MLNLQISLKWIWNILQKNFASNISTLLALRPEYSGRTRSIQCPPMHWLIASPDHPLPWHYHKTGPGFKHTRIFTIDPISLLRNYSKCKWERSRRCGCLVTWFCYHLIAKPGNKTATPSWPGPNIFSYLQKKMCMVHVPVIPHLIAESILLSWMASLSPQQGCYCCLLIPNHHCSLKPWFNWKQG